MEPGPCVKEGRGTKYLDVSRHVLVFVSEGYFESPNCMRELLRAVFKSKPIIALTEPEAKRGGLTTENVREELGLIGLAGVGTACSSSVWSDLA